MALIDLDQIPELIDRIVLARVEALPSALRARARDIGDARLAAEVELICERIARALSDDSLPE